jgi:hypothetical protein
MGTSSFEIWMELDPEVILDPEDILDLEDVLDPEDILDPDYTIYTYRMASYIIADLAFSPNCEN